MIASFFQSLEDHGVEYLLISGQATVLYGAATFSDDIDLWVSPTAGNCHRFLATLRACGASYYKLTPPFEPEFVSRGHGFHFLFRAIEDEPPVFLDVMGAPPRVDAFAAARASARRVETDWGRLAVLGLKDLVELKKTQRLEDYPIISNLALAWFSQPECRGMREDLAWALVNIFTLPALRLFAEAHPDLANALAGELPEAMCPFLAQVASGEEAAESVQGELNAWMQHRIAEFQQADRAHWRPIIAELRQLRSAGRLMPEGESV